jgi:hypothetical protein
MPAVTSVVPGPSTNMHAQPVKKMGVFLLLTPQETFLAIAAVAVIVLLGGIKVDRCEFLSVQFDAYVPTFIS